MNKMLKAKANKEKYRILDTGNFYFPVKYKGKNFAVLNTIDVNIDKKYNNLIDDFFKLGKKGTFFNMLAEPIWKSLKKVLNKEDKNCWFVPIRIYKFEDEYICSIDILRELK